MLSVSGGKEAVFLIVTLCLSARQVTSFVVPVPSLSVPATASSPACRGMASADVGVLGATPSLLMDDVLKGNATAARASVDMLMEVRGTDKMEQYLGEMLPPEQDRFPLWARMPLTRYSRRARALRLRKLLELSTPTASSESEFDEKDDGEARKRRTRNALFILLRNIADNPEFTGVSPLLSMARKDAKNEHISSEEMLKRTPDLETPKYEVLAAEKGGLEVRRYERFAVCSVTMEEVKKSGSDKESASRLANPQLTGATSFGALAGYLFGKNEEETAMKMTTPVFSEGDGASRKMSFVLPSDYWEEEDTAPTPLADSAVTVSSVEGCERAVLSFAGFGRKADVEGRSNKLRATLESNKEWQAVEDATVLLAQYNDPFTPPWKRRNEVSVSVEPRQ